MKNIGRYEILEEVGRGAMGIVYKASDPTIGRMVAIKVLSLDSSSEEGGTSARESFMREARAAGRLSHPGIVTIHDALEDPDTKNSYIVMEFIQGRTLEKILVDGPRPSLEKSLNIIRQVGEALEYAHQQQIIHRDLKPANILVSEDGRAKITDFGIARVMARDGSHRTTSVMGTPAYMAPEQLTGGELDARSDLFALGVLTYLMLSGEKPFTGDTAAVLFKIVYEDPFPPSQIKSSLNHGHDYLALRSLVKNRNRRYQNAREFLNDLDDVQNMKPPRSEAKFPLGEIRTGDRTLTTRPPMFPWKDQSAPSPAEKKFSLETVGQIAAGVLLVAVLGTAALIYRSFHRPTTPSTAVRSGPVPPSVGTPAPPATPPLQNSKAVNTATAIRKDGEAGKAAGSKSKAVGKTAADSGNKAQIPVEKKAVSSAAAHASEPHGSTNTAKPEPAKLQPTKSPTNVESRKIQVVCKFELQEGTLTVSNDTGDLLKEDLKGKKKSGFLHIKGGVGGSFSKPLTLPAGTSSISVHLQSSAGGVDLTRKTAVPPSSNSAMTLQIMITEDRLTLHWANQPQP
ncbi:MAG TPA: serine/threonine-protein kinase [Terriglobia bacterium]|nr:serine/threonine-protein kinase [Terriglobia bacterium]